MDNRSNPETVSFGSDFAGIGCDPDAPPLGPATVAGELGTLDRRYRVVRQLGKGGMGAVYLGFDADLDRPVAIKVMLPRYAADRQARERFLREARAAAKVRSDHVVTIYDVGEAGGVPFLAMELLQGKPLDAFLKGAGPLAVSQAARIGREAAMGLAAAHERGLVHRDVKPANLWLEAPGGRVKLLDFGLARGAEDGALTGAGAVVGTPAFMSPEQARGDAVDARSDLFSLGAVLYRLLTGKQPFAGATAMETLLAVQRSAPVPVRRVNPTVPEGLARLVDALLAKEPTHRPASASAVAASLAEFGKEGGAVAVPAVDETWAAVVSDAPTPARTAAVDRESLRVVWMALAGTLVAVGMLVGLVLMLTRHTPKKGPTVGEEPKEKRPGVGEVIPVEGPDKTPPPEPPAQGEVPLFFNGKDLAGWDGDPAVWKVEAGGMVGTHPPGGENQFLVCARPVRDFEVSFEARATYHNLETAQYAGLTFRGGGRDGWAGVNVSHTMHLYRFDRANKYYKLTKADRKDEPPAYRRFVLRVEGRRVTVHVDGKETSNAEYPDLPTGGEMRWLLTSSCSELRIRNIRFAALGNATAGVGPWRSLLTRAGSPPPGWKVTWDTKLTAKFDAVADKGEMLLRSSGDGNLTSQTAPRKNYHLRLDFRWAGASARRFDVTYHAKGSEAFYITMERSGNSYTNAHPKGNFCAEPGEVRGNALVPNGPPRELSRQPIRHPGKNQKPPGEWNTLELICLEDASIQLMNGKIVAVLVNQRRKPDAGKEEPITTGDVSLAVHDAVEFRRIEVRDITALPPEERPR